MEQELIGTGARAEAEPPRPSRPRADSQPESRTIGRYLALRRIGDGGMGTVFSAYDEQLDRRIAIKILHQAATAQGRQRLVREAQALARLGHPNVVYVYEVGEVDERLFLAMEYVEGCTLADWQTASKRTWPEILQMYIQAGRGLLAAHEAGLVHRDFKPENVLVGKDGRPRVVDFGLARAPQEAELPLTAAASPRPLDKALTVEGTILGTPQYMSPEQFCAAEVDSRSDQFSYCAALYEALYGRHPFASETLEGLRGRVMFGKVSPPPRDSAVPSVIQQALLRGLAPDPAQRFPSMSELLSALDIDPDRDAALDRRSSRRIGALIAVGFLSFIAGFYYWLLTGGVTYKLFVGSMATVFLSGVFGGVMVRRTLAQYAFHRGLFVCLMLGISLNLSMALIGTRMGIPLSYLGIASMVNIGCTYGFMAYHYLPLLWGCCAIACGSGLVLGILNAPAAWVLATGQFVYPVTTLGLAWIWFRAARKRQSSCEH